MSRGCRGDGGRSRSRVVRRVKQNVVDEVDYTVRGEDVGGGDASGRIGSADEDATRLWRAAVREGPQRRLGDHSH